MKSLSKPCLLCFCVIAAVGITGLVAGNNNGLLPVSGSGSSQLLPPDMDRSTPDALGSATMTVGGREYELDLQVFLKGREPHGLTIHATASHVFSGDGVQFSTSDAEILAPSGTPGIYIVNSNSKVVEGGTGHLAFHGTANMITHEVKFSIRGAIRLD